MKTHGKGSHAVFSQSVGGGGGAGSSGGGVVGYGGGGGYGSTGGIVTLANAGTVKTEVRSAAVFSRRASEAVAATVAIPPAWWRSAVPAVEPAMAAT